MSNEKIIDLGSLAPPDVVIKGVPCGAAGETCEFVISGALPLKMVIESNSKPGGLFSAEYKEFIYNILAIKTDRAILDKAFNYLTTAHYRKIDEQIAEVLTAAQLPDPQIKKKS